MHLNLFQSSFLLFSSLVSIQALFHYIIIIIRTRAPLKQNSSELQINAADGQYVVAYTLIPPKQSQPDILNPPPGKLLVCTC